MQKFKQQRTYKVQLVNITSAMSLLLLFLTMTHAQRPFFAGGRPAGGLNQKDKYNHPDLAAGIIPTKPVDNGIGNRFGGVEDNNNNAYASNIPQRAPIGMPVVYPEPIYHNLPKKQQQQPQTNYNNINNYPASSTSDSGSGITNRFGAADSDNEVINTKPPILPFDARGDVDLVNQLSRLPPDNQPFWFLNYQAIEAQRNRSVSNSGAASSPVARSTFAG